MNGIPIMKNTPSPEFSKMVETNTWHKPQELDELISTLKKLVTTKADNFYDRAWSWVLNSRCKYIDIRIDMRDGAFILHDRDMERISIDQLKYQYEK
jgi:hypothetical protein